MKSLALSQFERRLLVGRIAAKRSVPTIGSQRREEEAAHNGSNGSPFLAWQFLVPTAAAASRIRQMASGQCRPEHSRT